MAVHFLDSSALVKRYISEIGSAWVSGLFDPALGHEVFVAAVAGVEIVAAITRWSRESISDLSLAFNQTINIQQNFSCDQPLRRIEQNLFNIRFDKVPFCAPFGGDFLHLLRPTGGDHSNRNSS